MEGYTQNNTACVNELVLKVSAGVSPTMTTN